MATGVPTQANMFCRTLRVGYLLELIRRKKTFRIYFCSSVVSFEHIADG